VARKSKREFIVEMIDAIEMEHYTCIFKIYEIFWNLALCAMISFK